MRRAAAPIACVGLLLASSASATTLDEAIAAARAYNPQLRAVKAQVDAADARLKAARGARLPTIGLEGEYLTGRNDLRGFFGFGKADVDPRSVRLEMSQPLYTGGALQAGVDQARSGREAAGAQLIGADDELQVAVAQAFADVRASDQLVAASQAQLRAFDEWTRQADLRFKAGEIPRSDLELAKARRAEARAGLSCAQGDAAVARAAYANLVGGEPTDLTPPKDDGVQIPLDEALARAEAASPALQAAEAAVNGARAAVKAAAAQGAPSLALAARAEQVRDQFFPGYASDALVVGVRGRWTLFAGGRVKAATAEAEAGVRAAEARLDGARSQLKTTVIQAWSDLEASRLAAQASQDRAVAAATAVDSLGHEVRVGERPLADLLDAQRDLLGAEAGRLAAEGRLMVAARRLAVLTRSEIRKDGDVSARGVQGGLEGPQQP